MAKLAVCVSILLVLLVALTESSPTVSCCTQYQETPISVKVLKNFKVQEITEYCNIKAVIFITKRNRIVCANPDEGWVQKAMKFISHRKH